MDRVQHRRFLTYLETFPYFNGPSKKRLSREDWLEFDGEYRALLALGDQKDEEQDRRQRALAKVLLID